MVQPIEIYQAQDGQTQVEVRFEQETVWLSQAQMAQLFDTGADSISLHLKNIFAENELNEKSTTEDFSVVRFSTTRIARFISLAGVTHFVDGVLRRPACVVSRAFMWKARPVPELAWRSNLLLALCPLLGIDLRGSRAVKERRALSPWRVPVG